MAGLMNQIADIFTSEKTFDDYSVIVRTAGCSYRIWYDKETDQYRCDDDEVGNESLEALVVSLEQMIAKKGEAVLTVELI